MLHEDFVRRVVRRILQDPGHEDDVVQGTWLRVIESRNRSFDSIGGARAWLSRVSTNVARSLQRSESARARREERVASTEYGESANQSAERVEARQRVAQRVLDLEEPYKTVVLLRYEEGLSPREIAQRLDRSPGTIRSQLSRAHGILRTELDAEFGDRGVWAALAVPVGSTWKAPLPVGVASTWFLPIALLACAAVFGTWGLMSLDSQEANEQVAALAPQPALLQEPKSEPDSDHATDPRLKDRQVISASAKEESAPDQNIGGAALDDTPLGQFIRRLSKGQVAVQLVDFATGLSVGKGEVHAWSKEDRKVVAKGSVDRQGLLSFKLSEGEYDFRVPEDSLPNGWIPAPLQDSSHSPNDQGFHAPSVHVVGREKVAVQVPVHRACTISGHVFDFQGKPAKDMYVQVGTAKGGVYQVFENATTDAQGFYEVSIRSGYYRVRVGVVSKDHPLHKNYPRPTPQEADLKSGDQLTLDFHYKKGQVKIVGRLVDLEVIPGEGDYNWKNLSVTLMPRWPDGPPANRVNRYLLNDSVAGAYTDEEGRFAITGLLAGSYKLGCAVYDYEPGNRDSKLGAWGKRLELDLQAGQTMDLGDLRILRPRPCDVTGRVRLPASMRAHTLEMQVTYPSWGHGREYKETVPLNGDGSFTFFVHTSPDQTPGIVKLRKRGQKDWVLTQEFPAYPGSKQTLELHYP